MKTVEGDRRVALLLSVPEGELDPQFLVIEEMKEGFFLFRFAKDGACVGDTWHLSLEDAMHQAEYEFGPAVGGWLTVPEDASSSEEFALSVLYQA